MPAWPRLSNIEEAIPSSGTNQLGGSRAMPACLSLLGDDASLLEYMPNTVPRVQQPDAAE